MGVSGGPYYIVGLVDVGCTRRALHHVEIELPVPDTLPSSTESFESNSSTWLELLFYKPSDVRAASYVCWEGFRGFLCVVFHVEYSISKRGTLAVGDRRMKLLRTGPSLESEFGVRPSVREDEECRRLALAQNPISISIGRERASNLVYVHSVLEGSRISIRKQSGGTIIHFRRRSEPQRTLHKIDPFSSSKESRDYHLLRKKRMSTALMILDAYLFRKDHNKEFPYSQIVLDQTLPAYARASLSLSVALSEGSFLSRDVSAEEEVVERIKIRGRKIRVSELYQKLLHYVFRRKPILLFYSNTLTTGAYDLFRVLISIPIGSATYRQERDKRIFSFFSLLSLSVEPLSLLSSGTKNGMEKTFRLGGLTSFIENHSLNLVQNGLIISLPASDKAFGEVRCSERWSSSRTEIPIPQYLHLNPRKSITAEIGEESIGETQLLPQPPPEKQKIGRCDSGLAAKKRMKFKD
uniref:Uncharacterized protein n=1 Tax=Cucumis melo TaxID=3656 RepID=A0A9I9EE29_CUCME